MNKGHAIFKRMQRLQGGRNDVQEQDEFTPKDMAAMYAAIQRQNEQRRAERMNETGDYGNSPDVIYPEELELKRRQDQSNAERARVKVQGYAEGVPDIPPWEEPNPLPSPPPDPNVYINQYPSNFQSPPSSSYQGNNPSSPYISDAQAIRNYGFDPGDPRNDLTTGFGSSRPTQRVIGGLAQFGGNMVFPGLGTAVLGPGASWLTRFFQGLLGRHNVQNATQPYQTGQPTQGTDTGDGTDSTDDSTGTTSSAPPTVPDPTVGIGVDPTGNPAKPGEFWSNDFGRWGETDQYGTTPGNYAGPGPGLPQGRLGTGFGAGTVGNWSTALGFDSLGRGGGSANLSAFGGGPARSQARQIAKGIYTPMTGYGYGPLGGFTGTQNPGAAANIAGQQELHDILMANPGVLSGPISGNITRGTPMRQTVQMGSSDINPGLRIYMQTRKLKQPKGYAGGSSGIHIDPANKGKFTALQQRTGKSTAELKNSPNPLTRQRANFAMMAKRHFKPL